MSEAVQEILQRIQQLPEADRVLLEEQMAQSKRKRQGEEVCRADLTKLSRAELLLELRRHSHIPPPGTPDSLELLRQDRER